MDFSRRKFINVSVKLAGISLLPSLLMNSCMRPNQKDQLVIDYIGDQDYFEFYQSYFRKIKKTIFRMASFENSLSDDSDIVFLDFITDTKSSCILMLMEQGKNILSSFPIGNTLSEYASILEFTERYGRTLGLVNPLVFYPSEVALKNIITHQSIRIRKVRINCHPTELGEKFIIKGSAGTAQALLEMVTHLSGSFPISLKAECKEAGNLTGIQFNFGNFETNILFYDEQYGWNMEISGAYADHSDFSAIIDHTGLLSIDNEVEPRLNPDPGGLDNSIFANIEDFIKSCQEDSQPRVNSLDGLSSIILNTAVVKSIKTGSIVQL